MLVAPVALGFDPRNLLLWYPQDILIADQADCAGYFDEGGIVIRNTPAGHAFLDSWVSKFQLGWWHLGPMTTLEETLLENPEIAYAYNRTCRKYVLFEQLEEFRGTSLGNYLQFRGCAVFHRDALLGTYRRRTMMKHIHFVDPVAVALDELHVRVYSRTLFLHISGHKTAEMLRTIWKRLYPAVPDDSRCWTTPETEIIRSEHEQKLPPLLAVSEPIFRNLLDEVEHGYPSCFMRKFIDINGHSHFPENRPAHIDPIGRRSWDSTRWVYHDDATSAWDAGDDVDTDFNLEWGLSTASLGGYAGHEPYGPRFPAEHPS